MNACIISRYSSIGKDEKSSTRGGNGKSGLKRRPKKD